MGIEFHHSDCLKYLRTLPDESVHAVITDPPYGLSKTSDEDITRALTSWLLGDRERVPSGKRGFMGREWDGFVPPPAVWDECLRVLVPGGHMAVFAGSRTVDLMGLSIRLAGFEMRDGLAAWVYGSGFPKSLDVSKAIDKAAGAEREVIGMRKGAQSQSTGRYGAWGNDDGSGRSEFAETTAATDAACEWQGWGTALKPAHEPILLARKPLAGTVAANVLAHRAGAINVDACRVQGGGPTSGGGGWAAHKVDATEGWDRPYTNGVERTEGHDRGRWPTNVVLAHHPDCGPDEAPGPCVPGCQVAALDEQSGVVTSHGGGTQARSVGYSGYEATGRPIAKGDSGGASRFFPMFRYQAKAPKSERPQVDGKGHPTVKPLKLMEWLCDLLLAPGATVLDPFAGSGTTLQAARNRGFSAIGVEADEHSCRLIHERLSNGVKP